MNKVGLVLFAGAVVAMLLVVSSVSAVELRSVSNIIDKEDVVPVDQKDGEPTSFCILCVFVYADGPPPIGDIPCGWEILKCKDLDTGRIRWAISGLFSGYARFFGLTIGHTYKITPLRTDTLYIDVYMDDFLVYERFRLY